MRALKFIAQPTNAFFAIINQLSVRRLLPASDYCRALFRCLDCAQRFDYRALGSGRKLEGAAEHFIDSSVLNFWVRVLLKGAVKNSWVSLVWFLVQDSPKLWLVTKGLKRRCLSRRGLFRVYKVSSKHDRGWENSRQLCKPEKSPTPNCSLKQTSQPCLHTVIDTHLLIMRARVLS